MKLFFIVALCVFVSCMTIRAAEPVDSADLMRQQMFKAYGVADFGEIDAIRYTFNIQSGDRRVAREWSWEPHTGCVTFHGRGPQGTMIDYAYTHTIADSTDTTLTGFCDQRFTNDNYWLLFPFHLAWDSNMVISTKNIVLSKEYGDIQHFSVHYTSGGYTPGDTYVLFPDRTGLLQWWVFYRGGKQDQGLMMTWEDPVRAGPIVLTLSHYNHDRTTHLWFSDVAIRLHGSTTWIDAK